MGETIESLLAKLPAQLPRFLDTLNLMVVKKAIRTSSDRRVHIFWQVGYYANFDEPESIMEWRILNEGYDLLDCLLKTYNHIEVQRTIKDIKSGEYFNCIEGE